MDADDMLATGFTIFHPWLVCGMKTSLAFSTHLSSLTSCSLVLSIAQRVLLSPGMGLPGFPLI